MNKNPQFEKLLELANKICNGSAGVIARSKDNIANDTLHYNPTLKVFLFEYHRHRDCQPISTGSILQREDGRAPFTYCIHEYNGKPPYLEINLGNLISILHFVECNEQTN